MRQLQGDWRRKLQALATELGFDADRLRKGVTSEQLYETLRTLSWLAPLDRPRVVDAALRTCTWSPRVRTALARVLYEHDDPRATRTGVELLLWDGIEPLSVFGVDTLYHISNRDPSYLLSVAQSDADEWSDALLVQVLQTVRNCETTIDPNAIEWVISYLDRDSPEVRAEALEVIAQYGWSSLLWSQIDPETHLADRSPLVRRAAYRLVGAFGDEAAIDSLAAAVKRDPDDRARLVGVRQLRETDWRIDADLDRSSKFWQAWRWVAVREQFEEAHP
ncbi:hypothetical protein BRC82_06760 [Halobacteriales archaeon QS_1_67_19]|nr:MAG: hypothetical protein BRC82_06760 [Halobacteriales archaeon QS_1_67_19]